MPIPKKLSFNFLLFLMLFFISTTIMVDAQQPNSCEAFIDEVVTQLSNQCANTELGNACFGYDEATFIVEDEEDPLVNPDQPVPLVEIMSVQTADYSPSTDEWGVVYMRGQANLSTTLANSNALLYFILGDTTVRNEVTGDNALILPDQAVSVLTNNTASLYSFPPSFPDRISEVVHSVPAGTELLADGVDADGWIRVALLYQDTPVSRRSTAWLPGGLVDSTELDSLPVISQDSLTPMQSFTMLAADQPPGCNALPMSEVLVQSPGNVEGEIFVNGLRVRIFSTVIFRFHTTGQNRTDLRIIPLVGHAFLPDPDALDSFEDGILIPAGHFIDIPLVFDEESEQYFLDPDFYDGFVDFKEAFDEAKEAGDTIINPSIMIRLLFWERIPENILNYLIELFEIRMPSGVGRPRPFVEGGDKPPLIFNNLGIIEVP